MFTIPKILRPYFKSDKRLFGEVSRLIFSLLSEFFSLAAGQELPGACVVSYQSFGEYARFHPHWHVLVDATTVEAPDAWSKLRKQSWARLLRKVYEIDPFVCPKCQGAMSVVAIIEDPKELAKIIEWAKQQEREPPVTVCARSPP